MDLNCEFTSEHRNEEMKSTSTNDVIVHIHLHYQINEIGHDQIGFVKGTSIIQYNAQYDRYVKFFKYGPLINNSSDKLWKANLVGFHKYDPITRSEVCPYSSALPD